MSTIGVDAHTYALMHSRSIQKAMVECRNDMVEARKLAHYWMRDWYVIEDGPTDRELNEGACHDHW